MDKVSAKMGWESLNEKYDVDPELGQQPLGLTVVTLEQLGGGGLEGNLGPLSPDILVLVDLQGEVGAVAALAGVSPSSTSPPLSTPSSPTVVLAFNCSPVFTPLQKFGTFDPTPSPSSSGELPLFEQLRLYLRGVTNAPLAAQHAKAYEIVTDMWGRNSLEDLVFLFFVLVDTFFMDYPVKSVRSVSSTESTSMGQLYSMCSNCAKEMADCFSDPTCRAALDCLNSCKGNDQVCSYRCITSHETPAFENFARCILQKHNCMGNTATVPVFPDPEPLGTFRGTALDFATAEDIFIGHLQELPWERESQESQVQQGTESLLGTQSQSQAPFRKDFSPRLAAQSQSQGTQSQGTQSQVVEGTQAQSQETDLPWSWKVVCGQNPAYDYFADQHQLFYRDKRANVWYDPVFKVTKFDGEEVWRRRHYRVRRGKKPGQFYFSVLDNGVVSSEFWRILDCAEDLEWAVFYYGGAAAAAGTSYTGALLVTADGNWPKMNSATSERIRAALALGNIAMWELYEVTNKGEDSSNPPPLQIV